VPIDDEESVERDPAVVLRNACPTRSEAAPNQKAIE
jgi:hypothetical protein